MATILSTVMPNISQDAADRRPRSAGPIPCRAALCEKKSREAAYV